MNKLSLVLVLAAAAAGVGYWEVIQWEVMILIPRRKRVCALCGGEVHLFVTKTKIDWF
ncbi:MAG: hypothetical protein LBB48_01980 [Treponema sp.]|jgi:hypothetical protein|nr:hypothetical protein [Treponema sp.]